MEVNELIERAAQAAGTRYKLAQMLDVPASSVYAWEKGKPCPPGDIALMADIAGLDAQAWLVRATLEKYEGTSKGDQLARVLGKALVATGAVIASSGANAAAIFSARSDLVASCLEWLLYSTMYRGVKFRRA